MRLLQAFQNYLSKGLLLIDSSRYILQTIMSYALMLLSPCLFLGFDLQCLAWLGKMVQRFIDTHFQRSAV